MLLTPQAPLDGVRTGEKSERDGPAPEKGAGPFFVCTKSVPMTYREKLEG